MKINAHDAATLAQTVRNNTMQEMLQLLSDAIRKAAEAGHFSYSVEVKVPDAWNTSVSEFCMTIAVKLKEAGFISNWRQNTQLNVWWH